MCYQILGGSGGAPELGEWGRKCIVETPEAENSSVPKRRPHTHTLHTLLRSYRFLHAPQTQPYSPPSITPLHRTTPWIHGQNSMWSVRYTLSPQLSMQPGPEIGAGYCF